LRWASETGKAIDFYFIYGPKSDDVIAGYRKLTGAAPLLGKWVWGFWQCKERYSTQEEMLGIGFAIPRGPYAPRWHRAGLAVLEAGWLGLA